MLWVAVALAAGSSSAGTEGDALAAQALREVPDDPRSVLRAVDDPAARSPAGVVQVGPYVSVQVNVDSLGQNIVGDAANEPSIAVNPTNPDNIVIGWRQFDTIASNFRQAGWAYSTDGGQSWTHPGVLTPGTFRSDPVLDFDDGGTVYYQSLQGSFVLDMFESADGAASWSSPVPAFGGDKNWLVVDRSGGPGNGHLYEIWQRFFGCCDTRSFSRSTDGGASFEEPVEIDRFPTFGTLATGPAGEVYAAGIDGTAGQDFDTFVVSKSTDASDAQQPPTFAGGTVGLGGSMAFSDGPNPAGLLGQANVAVDRWATSPFQGNVYVLASVIPDLGGDPLDVHFVRSTDGGATWSTPRRVNDDPFGTAWQWFAAHAVAPNGRIDAIWNDTRASGLDNVSQLFYAYSYDAGESWSRNKAVSPAFDSHLGFPNQNKLGDYYTLVSDAAGADVAYAATFNGEQDVYYARLFPDCNGNGVSDVIDVQQGTSSSCNGNPIPDECEPGLSCTAAGGVPDGAVVPGAPLTVDRGAGGQIVLSWSASCGFGDGDYEIYEGAIGDFASHVPVVCTTAGSLSQAIAPAAGNTYYLVVPRNAEREGSYGLDGDGLERSPGPAVCLPQELGAC